MNLLSRNSSNFNYSLIELIFVFSQLLISSMIVFLSASFNIFFFAFLLFGNLFLSFFFIKRRGNISNSKLFKLFTSLLLFIVLSFINFTYPMDISGFMFHNANKFEIFFFSIVWYVNFLFFFNISIFNINRFIKFFSLFFFILAIYSNYRAYIYFRIDSVELRQHHYFYFLLTALPLCFFFFSRALRYVFLSITTIAVLFSFKRSGLIVCAFILLLMVINDYRGLKSKKIYLSILVLCFYFLVYMIQGNLVDAYERIIYRFGALESDGGSGRLDYVKMVFDFSNDNFFPNGIIGNGFWSMYSKTGHFIDFEWASIFYYYGLFALIIYLFFHLLMIKRIVLLFKTKNELFLSYSVCYSVFFTYSFIGELFCYQYLSIPLFIYLGYVEKYFFKYGNNKKVKLYSINKV